MSCCFSNSQGYFHLFLKLSTNSLQAKDFSLVWISSCFLAVSWANILQQKLRLHPFRFIKRVASVHEGKSHSSMIYVMMKISLSKATAVVRALQEANLNHHIISVHVGRKLHDLWCKIYIKWDFEWTHQQFFKKLGSSI